MTCVTEVRSLSKMEVLRGAGINLTTRAGF